MPRVTRRRSSITTERRGTPSSPSVIENGMNFQGNYENQRATRPSKWNGSGEWGTCNASGKSDNRGTGTAFGTGRMESPNIEPGATKITE